MIKASNVNVFLQGKKILNNISLEIERGTITCFLGKSGSGKTTLLKAIARLIRYEGKILYDAMLSDSQIGFTFQNNNLFNNMDVLNNCMDPLIVNGYDKQKAYEKSLQILTFFNMQEHLEKKPSQLSGGQQQRVAIARALNLNPQIILLDEPTSALDPENTRLLINLLQKLKQHGLTIIFSSHDLNFVKEMSDHIYFLQDGMIIESFDCTKKVRMPYHIENFIA